MRHKIKPIAVFDDSGDQFRALMDASPSVIHFKDTEGRYTAVNSAFEKMLGLPRAKILGRTILEMPRIEAEFVDHILALDRQVLSTGKPLQVKTRPPLADQHDTVTHLVKFPVFDSNGEIEGVGTIETDVTEHSRTEDELRETRRRLELAQRQAKIGYWRWSFEEERLTYWSEEAAGINPYPLDQGPIGYQEMLAPIHPDDRSRVEKIYEEADVAKRGFSLDYRVVNDDGRVTHIREVAEIENDGNGDPVAQVGFVQDITDEKLVEKNLREVSGRLALAQKQARVGYWRWSFFDENLSYWSEEAAEICQYPVDKPVGYEEMLSAVHPDDRDRLMREYKIADEKPCDYVTEYRVPRGDGRVTYVREMGEVEYDDSGKQIGHVGFVQDITELKEIESELRASEARLDGILTIAPEAIIVTGEDLTILRFNQGAERIFGYTRAEMEGQTLNPLLPEQFRAKHQAYFRDFAESSDTYRVMATRDEITGLRKDGTTFPAVASVAKLQLEGETVFVVALRDITERKLIEADLLAAKEDAEYANRAKSEFLANMSHELRTPLNSIIGFSQILSNQTFGPLGNPRYLEYANDIRNSGTHLLALIADILDISKIENRELVMDEEKLNVIQVVRECRKMVQVRAEAAQLAVTTEIAPDVHALLADRRLVMQILLNLLSNAIKFTPAGGQIMLRARLDARGATRLEVTDTGVGIAREDLPKVTHAFVQAGRKGGLYAQPGTGLGLSLVKSLVVLHGGHFSIGSKPGLGTRAMAVFPPERTIRH